MSVEKRRIDAGTPFDLLSSGEKRKFLRSERGSLAYERFLRVNALAFRTCPRCGRSVSMHFDSRVNRTVCSWCNSVFEGRVRGGEELTPTEVARKRRAEKAVLDHRREVDEWVFFAQSQDLAAELEELRVPSSRHRDAKFVRVYADERVQVMSSQRYGQTYPAEPKPRKMRVRKDAFEQFLKRLKGGESDE